MYGLIRKEADYAAKANLLYRQILGGNFEITDMLEFVLEELQPLAQNCPQVEDTDEDSSCSLLWDESYVSRLQDLQRASQHSDPKCASYAKTLIRYAQWLLFHERINTQITTSEALVQLLSENLPPEELALLLILTQRLLTTRDQKALDQIRSFLEHPDSDPLRCIARSVLGKFHAREQERRQQLRLNNEKYIADCGPRAWIELPDREQEMADKFLLELAEAQLHGYPMGAELDEFLAFSRDLQLHLLLIRIDHPALRNFLACGGRLLLQMLHDPYLISRFVKVLPEILLHHGKFSQSIGNSIVAYQSSSDERIRANLLEGLSPLLQLEEWNSLIWPIVEKNLHVSHPRLRSTALSVAFSYKPLDTLQIIEDHLMHIESFEELKSFRWLMQETKGFDQDYSLEFAMLEQELNTLNAAPVYQITGVVPRPNP